MGDAPDMHGGGGSISTDDSCPWTEVSASNDRLNAPNKEIFEVLDPSTVSMGRQIGEGGQGCIYEAKFYLPFSFKPLRVAVKKFKPLFGISQGRFPPEICLSKFSNVLSPFAVFFEKDTLCTVMARLSCDLRAHIDARMKYLRDERLGYDGPPFPKIKDAVSIIVQLAMAMKALHDLGIYHKDLKAANILVRIYRQDDGHESLAIHVADFERSEGVVGTGFYRAPEVLQSIGRIPLSEDQWLKADIYSFGMVCYELLTGRIPFEGYPFYVYTPVLNGERPELPDHVPEDLEDIIRRCWHANPDYRPSWTDIIQLLSQNDEYRDVVEKTRNYMDIIASMEWSAETSIKLILMKLKLLVHNYMVLDESDSKGFANHMYWALEFVATVEKYVSKFHVELTPENSLICGSYTEARERVKLLDMLKLQSLGCVLRHTQSINQQLEQELEFNGVSLQLAEGIQSLMSTLCRAIEVVHGHMKPSEDPKSWIGWLLFYCSVIKWQLWVEVANDRVRKSTMELILQLVKPNYSVGAFFLFVCLTTVGLLDTYIYVLALFTSEPILLGVQYGLYRLMGCNNFLYRSSGYRICRLQRAWMNYSRYKLLSVALVFSLYFLFTSHGWRGILVWNIFPCILRFSPYWRPYVVTPGEVGDAHTKTS